MRSYLRKNWFWILLPFVALAAAWLVLANGGDGRESTHIYNLR